MDEIPRACSNVLASAPIRRRSTSSSVFSKQDCGVYLLNEVAPHVDAGLRDLQLDCQLVDVAAGVLSPGFEDLPLAPLQTEERTRVQSVFQLDYVLSSHVKKPEPLTTV
jgi:hypothetical protein